MLILRSGTRRQKILSGELLWQKRQTNREKQHWELSFIHNMLSFLCIPQIDGPSFLLVTGCPVRREDTNKVTASHMFTWNKYGPETQYFCVPWFVRQTNVTIVTFCIANTYQLSDIALDWLQYSFESLSSSHLVARNWPFGLAGLRFLFPFYLTLFFPMEFKNIFFLNDNGKCFVCFFFQALLRSATTHRRCFTNR